MKRQITKNNEVKMFFSEIFLTWCVHLALWLTGVSALTLIGLIIRDYLKKEIW